MIMIIYGVQWSCMGVCMVVCNCIVWHVKQRYCNVLYVCVARICMMLYYTVIHGIVWVVWQGVVCNCVILIGSVLYCIVW